MPEVILPLEDALIVPSEWGPPEPRWGVEVALQPSRSDLRSLVLDIDVTARSETYFNRFGKLVRRWEFDEAVAAERLASLVAMFDGQPPGIASVRWLVRGEGRLGPLTDPGKGIRDWFDAKREHIGGPKVAPSPDARKRLFFLELDRLGSREIVEHTRPCLSPDALQDWIDSLRIVNSLLIRRMTWRVERNPDEFDAVPDGGRYLDAVSTFMLDLLSRHFPGASRMRIDPEAVLDGFTKFAAGDYRFNDPFPHSNGRPDGSFFFYFGDLALMASEACLRRKGDTELWRSLLGPLISVQRVYMHAYGSPPQRMSEYGGGEPEEELDGKCRRELTRGWDASDDPSYWSKRMDENVWEACEGAAV